MTRLLLNKLSIRIVPQRRKIDAFEQKKQKKKTSQPGNVAERCDCSE